METSINDQIPHETSSFFIDNQCLFGAYPTQEQVIQLEAWGIDVFVNLVNPSEKKIKPYVTTVSSCIKFIIPDQQPPDRVREFCSLVVQLCQRVRQRKKIFIHCKAGHGRSSLVVACMLAHYYKISAHEAIHMTKRFHRNRKTHSKKMAHQLYWKKALPMNTSQVHFIVSLFKTVTFDPLFTSGNYEWWLKEKYKMMLMNTGLGTIVGTPHAHLIQMVRDQLVENVAFF